MNAPLVFLLGVASGVSIWLGAELAEIYLRNRRSSGGGAR